MTTSKTPELFCSLTSLLDNERRGFLGSGIVKDSVTTKMRTILVEWLIEVFISFKITTSSYFATINILDAYLSRVPVEKENLQLVGIVSMFLATTYHEISCPEVNDFIYISDYTYTTTEFNEMTREVFKTVGCNVNVPIESDYLSVVTIGNKKVRKLSQLLLISMTLNYFDFLPSVLATAVYKVICLVLDERSESGRRIDEQSESNPFAIQHTVISSCINSIVRFCRNIKRSKFNNFKKLDKKGKLAQIIDSISKLELLQVSQPVEEYRKSFYTRDVTLQLLDVSNVSKGEKIGQGTYGVVKKVEYKNNYYAMKKIFHYEDALSSSFLREVSVMLSLDHINIAKVKHISCGLNSIFMDLGDSDLHDFLETNPMDYQMQIDCAYQLFTGLEYIHSMGCLHRDIKPRNIIVYTGEESWIFVLSDFGCCRGCQIVNRDNKFTHEITTIHYRAPEILLGSSKYSDKVDVWSLLCTLYECSSRTILFPGDCEIDQLYKIFRVLGTPDDNSWNGVSSLRNYKDRFPRWKRMKNLFSDDMLSDCYKEVLTKCLVMNPKLRLSSKEIRKIIKSYI